jgi:hypothetical protein
MALIFGGTRTDRPPPIAESLDPRIGSPATTKTLVVWSRTLSMLEYARLGTDSAGNDAKVLLFESCPKGHILDSDDDRCHLRALRLGGGHALEIEINASAGSNSQHESNQKKCNSFFIHGCILPASESYSVSWRIVDVALNGMSPLNGPKRVPVNT